MTMALPKPLVAGRMFLEETIWKRRSTRNYLRRPTTKGNLSQILWAAQGISSGEDGCRVVPSTAALYPLELHVSVRHGGVVGGEPGIYYRRPARHIVTVTHDGDYSAPLQLEAGGQDQAGEAAADMVMTDMAAKLVLRYGERSVQCVPQESGHAAQNVYLQSTALGLGIVVLEAFQEEKVCRLIGRELDEKPLCIMPMGIPP